MPLQKVSTFITLKSLLFLTGLSILIFQGSCTTKTEKRSGEVNISDISNGSAAEAKAGTQKQYDVEVYRTSFMGNGYKVTYFPKETDSLNFHSATYMTDEVFDKASYNWLTDTSVSIKLFSSSSKKEKVFKVFGYGSRSGMSD